MKEVKVKEVIPIENGKMVQYTTYTCETCGKSYQDKELIKKCPMCGKDMCVMCQKEPHLYDEDILIIGKFSKSLIFESTCGPHDYFKICKTCFSNLRNDRMTYLKEVQTIVDKFNQDIASLTKRFIEEHKEPKR